MVNSKCSNLLVGQFLVVFVLWLSSRPFTSIFTKSQQQIVKLTVLSCNLLSLIDVVYLCNSLVSSSLANSLSLIDVVHLCNILVSSSHQDLNPAGELMQSTWWKLWRSLSMLHIPALQSSDSLQQCNSTAPRQLQSPSLKSRDCRCCCYAMCGTEQAPWELPALELMLPLLHVFC